MASMRVSNVRAAAFRSAALSFAKACSSLLPFHQGRQDVPGSDRVGSIATPRGLRRYRRDLVQRRAMTFFERQPEMPQPFPKAPSADLHVMLRYKPGLQLGKHRIGFAHHM